MSFIKIKNVVINTDYIAAVMLGSCASTGKGSVSILIVTPSLPVNLNRTHLSEVDRRGHCSYEWLDFTGREAIALQDYFTNFNNVVDLLPDYSEPTPGYVNMVD